MNICCLFTHPPSHRWLFFLSRTAKMIFSWNCGPWWFMKRKSMAAIILRVKKAYTGNTKLIPVAPDDILRSYEEKLSVCARNWTFTTFLINYNPETWADSQEWCSVCWTGCADLNLAGLLCLVSQVQWRRQWRFSPANQWSAEFTGHVLVTVRLAWNLGWGGTKKSTRYCAQQKTLQNWTIPNRTMQWKSTIRELVEPVHQNRTEISETVCSSSSTDLQVAQSKCACMSRALEWRGQINGFMISYGYVNLGFTLSLGALII